MGYFSKKVLGGDSRLRISIAKSKKTFQNLKQIRIRKICEKNLHLLKKIIRIEKFFLVIFPNYKRTKS